MQLTGFSGKTALVTGAAGGIGAAMVQTLAVAGARVIATDATLPVFDHTPNVICRSLDVTSSAAVDALVTEVEKDIGPIDLLVSLAGVLETGLVTETTDSQWIRVFSVNTEGLFYVTRAVSRAMLPRGAGAMVAVSSNAAAVPRQGMAAYGASKAAASLYMRSLGLELAPHGIRCNIVAPGSTRTPMQTGMWDDASGEERVIRGLPEAYKPGIPLGKIAEPQDIANAVMFLLSDQAGQITMADLFVDGGATQQV